MQVNGVKGIIFILISALLTVGCASLRFSDYEQKVLVQSEPAGAKIYQDGKYLGDTPKYIRLRRSNMVQEVELEAPTGERRPVFVNYRYDWNGSFYPNLVFLTLAPVGWLVDYFNGTAFDYKQPQPLTFEAWLKKENKKRKSLEEVKERIAIAPPLTDDEVLSDDLGLWLEKKLAKEFPKAEILPFTSTQKIFWDEDFDYNQDQDKDDRRSTMGRLLLNRRVTRVAFTRAELTDDGAQVSGSFWNSRTGEREEKIKYQIAAKEAESVGDRTWTQRLGQWVHFAPNYAHIDIAEGVPALFIGEEEFQGVTYQAPGAVGAVSNVLGSIGIGHIDPPTNRRDWRFFFKFVPSVSFRYGVIRFKSLEPIHDEEFTRFSAFLGYGPSLGMVSRYGQPYVNLLLGPQYTQVEWDEEGHNKEGHSALGYQVELGYLYFIDRHWNVRFFWRSTDEDAETWGKAIHDVYDPTVRVDSSAYRFVGFSVGYYFPHGRNPLRWVASDR